MDPLLSVPSLVGACQDARVLGTTCNWGLCPRPLQGFRDNLHAVFCLAENAVGPNATRPDDIHLLYSGK